LDLPREDDPLQLGQFLTDTRNLLDECYRKTLASSGTGPNSILIVHLVLAEIEESGRIITTPRSLEEIGNIYPTLDRQLLRRFIKEHSYVMHITHKMVDDKHLLAYCVPSWLRDFFFDPDRSRSFYSTSWVIDKCQQAMKGLIDKSNRQNYSPFPFFMQTEYGETSNASRLLEHVRNGADSNDLLLFLRCLSKIDWLDMYKRERWLTHEIAHWVCTSLVG
jgi:hypothetical protein